MWVQVLSAERASVCSWPERFEAGRHGSLYAHFKPHDSFYLGAEIFYKYIVQNRMVVYLRTEQKSPEGNIDTRR
jgi:hypothetical protein